MVVYASMDAEVGAFFKVMSSNMISLQASEIMILLGIITLCLLFRWNRMGMAIVYIDAYRWGWLFFQANFGNEYRNFMMGYYLFGGLVLILFAVGMLIDGKS